MIKLNGNIVSFGQFPNQEFNLPIEGLDVERENYIELNYESNNDLIHLLLLTSYLSSVNSKSELYISYLPYSRMDRANGSYAISLDAVAQFINNMHFTRVTIREPHSEESLNKINNSIAYDWCGLRIGTVINLLECNSLFYPDKGARDRYSKYTSFLASYGEKERDFNTGNIVGYGIKGRVGTRVLIVDDICSKGGTFVRASKLLRKRGAIHVSLLVSYCEENVFNGNIFDYIDVIYTSKESLMGVTSPRIIKIK